MNRPLSSFSAIDKVAVGTRVVDKAGHTVLRVRGGWRYEASSAAGLFQAYEMVEFAPLHVVEVVVGPTSAPPTPRVPARVMGRLYWDPTHPSPWVSFEGITAYRNWATEVRQALPGIRTELGYLDYSHTADSLLHAARDKAEELRS